MKSYPIHEARADFSMLVERALAGEPCRVTRFGEEAMGLVTAILTDFSDRVPGIDLETARHVARLGEATYQQPVALRT